MEFKSSIIKYWVGYANFQGRTSKRSYWWAVLFVVVAGMAMQALFPGYDTLDSFMGYSFTQHHDSTAVNLWQVGTLLPNIALLVRRLRDTNRSGANAWFLALPVIGWIILLVYTLEQGTPGANQYGESSE